MELLDFSGPFNVNILDKVVHDMFNGTSEERNIAQTVLTKLKEHPQAWTRVDTILEHSTSDPTKYIALQILDDLIKYRWKILPPDQREGIKNYTVELIIKLSSDNDRITRHKLILNRLNILLVQVLKQDWPHNWKNFIPDIVAASRSNECICENNMRIFMTLSEEVFDFSKGEMTVAKINELKSSLNQEFFAIYQLCDFVLANSQKPSLLHATLETLLRYLSWIPIGFIFETPLLVSLTTKFFPAQKFRNITLQCLTEIAQLQLNGQYAEQYENMFVSFMTSLYNILPINMDLRSAYAHSTEEDQNFVQNLAIFFSSLFTHHRTELEKEAHTNRVLDAHQYLVQISSVDNRELFKICLDYWSIFAKDLYNEVPLPQGPLMLETAVATPRRQLYSPILSRVRRIVISSMAKPEEIIIVEDENGHLIRERVPDGEAMALYKLMRETLVFLTHLDYDDTQKIMLEKLAAQVDGKEWSWYNLNTLCWAIGSIAGAQSEARERRFLVIVIKDLLGLCEMKKGKDNKAVIASNIMYIVGQYPRFLIVHWKFLSTVVNKLFEFMHETHHGVQDMSCDTFLKITKSCAQKFAIVHPGEDQTFTMYVLQQIAQIISDLNDSQIHTFYEAVGYMINAHELREMEPLIALLMDLPNQTWRDIMNQAKQNIDVLNQMNVIHKIANILKTNVHACSTIGRGFITQIGKIYLDILNVCKYYSEQISKAVAANENATRTPIVKEMRTVKRETLKLITTFIGVTNDIDSIVNNILPPLLPTVLDDYKASVPDARDHEVLLLMEKIVSNCKGRVTAEIPRMFDCVFECTLMMISQNFQDYPEIRLEFFNFLRSVNKYCFEAFMRMPAEIFKLIIHSILWGIKHTVRNISDTALDTLKEVLEQIQRDNNIANAFCQTYFLALLSDIFFVLTDTFHKTGFKRQTRILMMLISIVECGSIVVPLWDPSKINDTNMNNRRFLREHIMFLLSNAFKNLSQKEIHDFVVGLFQYSSNDIQTFETHLRDFLVKMKEFTGGDDNSKLFLEEQEAARRQIVKQELSVPGLVGPYDSRRSDSSMVD